MEYQVVSVEELNDILADAPFLKSYGFQRVKGQLKNQGEANVENEATAKGLI